MKKFKFIKNWKEIAEDVIFTILLIIASCMIMFICSLADAHAQDYKRIGNKFVQVSSSSRDTLITEYTLVDSKGTERPIIINKANGRCYTWRISAKSGKGYRAYLRNDLSLEISKELGIEFVPAKKE